MPTWQLELGRIEHHRVVVERLADASTQVVARAPDVFEPVTLKIALAQVGYEVPLRQWSAERLSWGLPRTRAPLDDAWLVAQTAARRYWLEVPYGVCRGEADLYPPPQLGPPRFPLDVAADDAVLPWRAIEFALGWSSGWQLAAAVVQRHLGDLELVASRAAPGAPPPLEVTSTIGGRALALTQLQRWSAQSASVHVARFRFARPSLGTRTFMQLSVACGDETFHLDLPTSLANPSHRSASHIGAMP